MTDTLKQTVDDALRTKELVKVQFSKNIETEPKEVANALAESVGADVVQVIGRTAALYRLNPDLHT